MTDRINPNTSPNTNDFGTILTEVLYIPIFISIKCDIYLNFTIKLKNIEYNYVVFGYFRRKKLNFQILIKK